MALWGMPDEFRGGQYQKIDNVTVYLLSISLSVLRYH